MKNQKWEIENQKSKIKNQKPTIKNPKSKIKKQKLKYHIIMISKIKSEVPNSISIARCPMLIL